MSRSVLMSITAGSVFILFILLYFVYNQGVVSGHQQYDQDQALISQLNSTIKTVSNKLTEAEKNLIISRRQQQIQEEAYKQMSRAYANSEQKNSVLGSRLDFYRSIISPKGGQSGPAIQGVETQYSQGKLSFDITLVQAIKHKHQVRGGLRVSLYDDNTLLSNWPVSSERSINYQYFQQVSGAVEISELPKKARLKVELQLQDGKKLERWFDVVSKIENQ